MFDGTLIRVECIYSINETQSRDYKTRLWGVVQFVSIRVTMNANVLLECIGMMLV